MPKLDQNIQSHYTVENLTDSILSLIKKAGLDIDNLVPDDLMIFDEFHVRGRNATVKLAESAGIEKNMRVLDIGSGIGGPSRYLATHFGCHVTGIDLTEEYCSISRLFAEKLGLKDNLTYHCCNALEMPFENESFDVIWTQHVAMNIEDKHKLYSETARVLKPNGTFAIYDILADKNQPIHFPVPWAKDPSISFLATLAEMNSYLKQNGLVIDSSTDYTQEGIEWLHAMSEKIAKEGPPPLSVKTLMGNDFGLMIKNIMTNLTEKRLAVFQIIANKNSNA